jgi:hypothetical protein
MAGSSCGWAFDGQGTWSYPPAANQASQPVAPLTIERTDDSVLGLDYQIGPGRSGERDLGLSDDRLR